MNTINSQFQQSLLGGLGLSGSLLSQHQPYPNPSTTVSFNQYVTLAHYQDKSGNWCVKIELYQGPTAEKFVLYDGPFPVTKDGVLGHFATLTEEALKDGG